MNKRLRILESSLLTLTAFGILCFAWSENYGLLMKESFRWLSLSGSFLMLVLGLASFWSSQKRATGNSLIFGLMLLLVVIGKPYKAPDNMIQPPDAEIEAGLWDQVDLKQFPRIELKDLATRDTEAVYRSGESFTTIGIVKKMEELEHEQSFAIMTSMMYCCLADAIAVGVRIPSDQRNTLEDGQWVMVSGKLVKEATELNLPNFRFGRAMMSTIHKSYYLQPEKIMSYSREAQLPPLTTQLERETTQLFAQALQKSGYWETLSGEEAYTLFVPIDKAIESLKGPNIETLSESALRAFASAHIVPGRHKTEQLQNLDAVTNLAGDPIPIQFENGKLTIDDSRILMKNLESRNGIIHFIYPPLVDSDQP